MIFYKFNQSAFNLIEKVARWLAYIVLVSENLQQRFEQNASIKPMSCGTSFECLKAQLSNETEISDMQSNQVALMVFRIFDVLMPLLLYGLILNS